MNIFYLDKSAEVSAKAMTNKHVVKMILESAQLLSTAHHELSNSVDSDLYKRTHYNHPSAVWVRKSSNNYKWLYEHFIHLCSEYTSRYGKIHATETKLGQKLSKLPDRIPRVGFTEPPCAMPDHYVVVGNSAESYRRYYESEKLHEDNDIIRYQKVLERAF